MTPLQQIEEGIKKEDWSLVIQGYKGMTGVDLGSKKKPRRSKKAKEVEKPINEFVDDGSISADLTTISKKLVTRKDREARPEHQLVDIECGRCKKVFKLDPFFKPKRFDKGDDPSVYICESCGPRVR